MNLRIGDVNAVAVGKVDHHGAVVRDERVREGVCVFEQFQHGIRCAAVGKRLDAFAEPCAVRGCQIVAALQLDDVGEGDRRVPAEQRHTHLAIRRLTARLAFHPAGGAETAGRFVPVVIDRVPVVEAPVGAEAEGDQRDFRDQRADAERSAQAGFAVELEILALQIAFVRVFQVFARQEAVFVVDFDAAEDADLRGEAFVVPKPAKEFKVGVDAQRRQIVVHGVGRVVVPFEAELFGIADSRFKVDGQTAANLEAGGQRDAERLDVERVLIFKLSAGRKAAAGHQNVPTAFVEVVADFRVHPAFQDQHDRRADGAAGGCIQVAAVVKVRTVGHGLEVAEREGIVDLTEEAVIVLPDVRRFQRNAVVVIVQVFEFGGVKPRPEIALITGRVFRRHQDGFHQPGFRTHVGDEAEGVVENAVGNRVDEVIFRIGAVYPAVNGEVGHQREQRRRIFHLFQRVHIDKPERQSQGAVQAAVRTVQSGFHRRPAVGGVEEEAVCIEYSRIHDERNGGEGIRGILHRLAGLAGHNDRIFLRTQIHAVPGIRQRDIREPPEHHGAFQQDFRIVAARADNAGVEADVDLAVGEIVDGLNGDERLHRARLNERHDVFAGAHGIPFGQTAVDGDQLRLIAVVCEAQLKDELQRVADADRVGVIRRDELFQIHVNGQHAVFIGDEGVIRFAVQSSGLTGGAGKPCAGAVGVVAVCRQMTVAVDAAAQDDFRVGQRGAVRLQQLDLCHGGQTQGEHVDRIELAFGAVAFAALEGEFREGAAVRGVVVKAGRAQI